MSEEITGWLFKQGGFKGGRKTWKKRWFFIKDRQIHYSQKSSSALLGSLPLDGDTVVFDLGGVIEQTRTASNSEKVTSSNSTNASSGLVFAEQKTAGCAQRGKCQACKARLSGFRRHRLRICKVCEGRFCVNCCRSRELPAISHGLFARDLRMCGSCQRAECSWLREQPHLYWLSRGGTVPKMSASSGLNGRSVRSKLLHAFHAASSPVRGKSDLLLATARGQFGPVGCVPLDPPIKIPTQHVFCVRTQHRELWVCAENKFQRRRWISQLMLSGVAFYDPDALEESIVDSSLAQRSSRSGSVLPSHSETHSPLSMTRGQSPRSVGQDHMPARNPVTLRVQSAGAQGSLPVSSTTGGPSPEGGDDNGSRQTSRQTSVPLGASRSQSYAHGWDVTGNDSITMSRRASAFRPRPKPEQSGHASPGHADSADDSDGEYGRARQKEAVDEPASLADLATRRRRGVGDRLDHPNPPGRVSMATVRTREAGLTMDQQERAELQQRRSCAVLRPTISVSKQQSQYADEDDVGDGSGMTGLVDERAPPQRHNTVVSTPPPTVGNPTFPLPSCDGPGKGGMDPSVVYGMLQDPVREEDETASDSDDREGPATATATEADSTQYDNADQISALEARVRQLEMELREARSACIKSDTADEAEDGSSGVLRLSVPDDLDSPAGERKGRDQDSTTDSNLECWNVPWEDIEFLSKLGDGMFAEVYACRLWGTPVAVKLLKAANLSGAELFGDGAADPEGSTVVSESLGSQDVGSSEGGMAPDRQWLEAVNEELNNEMRILAGLRHPNLLLYIGTCVEYPVILTEWCQRGALSDLLWDADQPLPCERMLQLAMGIAQGMNYLHSLSPPIVHRDLKADNILIDANFAPKVADFGLSYVGNTDSNGEPTIEDDSGPGDEVDELIGTPQWMAPEILEGVGGYSQKSDVYSFGIVLVEIVTRRLPYWESWPDPEVRPSIEEVSDYVLDGASPSLPAWSESFLNPLIRVCLSRDPSSRPNFADIIACLREKQDIPRGALFHRFDLPRLATYFSAALDNGLERDSAPKGASSVSPVQSASDRALADSADAAVVSDSDEDMQATVSSDISKAESTPLQISAFLSAVQGDMKLAVGSRSSLLDTYRRACTELIHTINSTQVMRVSRGDALRTGDAKSRVEQMSGGGADSDMSAKPLPPNVEVTSRISSDAASPPEPASADTSGSAPVGRVRPWRHRRSLSRGAVYFNPSSFGRRPNAMSTTASTPRGTASHTSILEERSAISQSFGSSLLERDQQITGKESSWFNSMGAGRPRRNTTAGPTPLSYSSLSRPPGIEVDSDVALPGTDETLDWSSGIVPFNPSFERFRRSSVMTRVSAGSRVSSRTGSPRSMSVEPELSRVGDSSVVSQQSGRLLGASEGFRLQGRPGEVEVSVQEVAAPDDTGAEVKLQAAAPGVLTVSQSAQRMDALPQTAPSNTADQAEDVRLIHDVFVDFFLERLAVFLQYTNDSNLQVVACRALILLVSELLHWSPSGPVRRVETSDCVTLVNNGVVPALWRLTSQFSSEDAEETHGESDDQSESVARWAGRLLYLLMAGLSPASANGAMGSDDEKSVHVSVEVAEWLRALDGRQSSQHPAGFVNFLEHSNRVDLQEIEKIRLRMWNRYHAASMLVRSGTLQAPSSQPTVQLHLPGRWTALPRQDKDGKPKFPLRRHKARPVKKRRAPSTIQPCCALALSKITGSPDSSAAKVVFPAEAMTLLQAMLQVLCDLLHVACLQALISQRVAGYRNAGRCYDEEEGDHDSFLQLQETCQFKDDSQGDTGASTGDAGRVMSTSLNVKDRTACQVAGELLFGSFSSAGDIDSASFDRRCDETCRRHHRSHMVRVLRAALALRRGEESTVVGGLNSADVSRYTALCWLRELYACENRVFNRDNGSCESLSGLWARLLALALQLLRSQPDGLGDLEELLLQLQRASFVRAVMQFVLCSESSGLGGLNGSGLLTGARAWESLFVSSKQGLRSATERPSFQWSSWVLDPIPSRYLNVELSDWYEGLVRFDSYLLYFEPDAAPESDEHEQHMQTLEDRRDEYPEFLDWQNEQDERSADLLAERTTSQDEDVHARQCEEQLRDLAATDVWDTRLPEWEEAGVQWEPSAAKRAPKGRWVLCLALLLEEDLRVWKVDYPLIPNVLHPSSELGDSGRDESKSDISPAVERLEEAGMYLRSALAPFAQHLGRQMRPMLTQMDGTVTVSCVRCQRHRMASMLDSLSQRVRTHGCQRRRSSSASPPSVEDRKDTGFPCLCETGAQAPQAACRVALCTQPAEQATLCGTCLRSADSGYWYDKSVRNGTFCAQTEGQESDDEPGRCAQGGFEYERRPWESDEPLCVVPRRSMVVASGTSTAEYQLVPLRAGARHGLPYTFTLCVPGREGSHSGQVHTFAVANPRYLALWKTLWMRRSPGV